MRKYINISKLRDEYAKKKIGRTGRAISQTYTFGSEDCISRKQAVEALTGWETEPLDEDIVRTLNNLPPVNKKQITGKLETAETATSEGEESTMNQPKSKLDLISRQEVLGYIDRLTGSGLGKMKSLEYIKKYVERMESSVAPKPVGDCISRQQAAWIALMSYFMPQIHTHEDATKALREASDIINSIPPVTPTERTGWIPVSERLPEDLEEVVVTWVNRNPPVYYRHEKDKPQTGIAVLYRDTWHWWDSTIVDVLAEYGSRCEIEHISEDIEIIAWQPLPESYRPEGENK